MEKLSLGRGIKLRGNVNRIAELTNNGKTAQEISKVFALEGVRLEVVNGDFPLRANLSELTRVAVSKSAVKTYLTKPTPPEDDYAPALA